MPDVEVKTQGGRVQFHGITQSGRDWIYRNVVASFGSHKVSADESVDLLHKAVQDGLDVKLVK